MSRFYNLDQAPFNSRELSKAIVAAIAGQYNGAFFDASDLSTMYQDAAGTIPVTAMEQPVGLWKDKSGRGNHAAQSITASRPVVSARKNWLLATDTLSTQNVTTVAAQQTLSFTGTGSVTLSGTATGTLAGTGANNRVSLTLTPAAGTLTLTVSGDVRFGQLEYGPTATTYQRVNTTTDYDTAGFPRYLRFDGVDDYLNLPYMGLYANGSASVIAALGYRGYGSIGQIVAEGSSETTDAMYCLTRINQLGVTEVLDLNDAGVWHTAQLLPQLTAANSILSVVDTGASVTAAINGALGEAVNTFREGTRALVHTRIGALGFHTGVIVDRLNGNLYGLIITKSALSDSDRRKCEVYQARKAGVQL